MICGGTVDDLAAFEGDHGSTAIRVPPQVGVSIRFVHCNGGAIAAVLRRVRTREVLHPCHAAVVARSTMRWPDVIAAEIGAARSVAQVAGLAGQALPRIDEARVERGRLAVVTNGSAVRGEHGPGVR